MIHHDSPAAPVRHRGLASIRSLCHIAPTVNVRCILTRLALGAALIPPLWLAGCQTARPVLEQQPLDQSSVDQFLSAGRDARYWGLAQALSALYPAGTDEKRWVDGVLARKKGLGF